MWKKRRREKGCRIDVTIPYVTARDDTPPPENSFSEIGQSQELGYECEKNY
jgi:hypothetical protein